MGGTGSPSAWGWRDVALLAAVQASVAGCASYGSHLSATPLSSGATSVLVAADALVIDRGFGPQVVPNPEAGVRLGLAENVDAGARANVGSVELNVRWRLLDEAGLDVAVVPGVGFGFVPVTNSDTGVFNAHTLASLIAGARIALRADLVIGARGVATYAFPLTAFRGELAGAKWIHSIGGVGGVRFPIGETTFLFPEVNVLVPYDTERAEWYFPTLQGGIGLEFE